MFSFVINQTAFSPSSLDATYFSSRIGSSRIKATLSPVDTIPLGALIFDIFVKYPRTLYTGVRVSFIILIANKVVLSFVPLYSAIYSEIFIFGRRSFSIINKKQEAATLEKTPSEKDAALVQYNDEESLHK